MTNPERISTPEEQLMDVPHVVMWRVHRAMSHEQRRQVEVKPGEWFRVVALDETVEGLASVDSLDPLLQTQLRRQWQDIQEGALRITVPVADSDGSNCREHAATVVREMFVIRGFFSLGAQLTGNEHSAPAGAREKRQARTSGRLSELFRRHREH